MSGGEGGSDSDRKCPGLSPGLLSGRVCASLSACLSSPLLSILLKTVGLLIIRTLLFWNDMFSLHQYFILIFCFGAQIPPPTPSHPSRSLKNGSCSNPAPEAPP